MVAFGSSADLYTVANLVCLAAEEGTVTLFRSFAVGGMTVHVESFTVECSAACLMSSAVGCTAEYFGNLVDKESTAVHLGCLAGKVKRVILIGHSDVQNTEAHYAIAVGTLEDDIVGLVISSIACYCYLEPNIWLNCYCN